MRQYFGKYRGKVENNLDPEGRARITVSVSAVTGSNPLNWALPSLPFAGSGVGLWAIPPVGANVWVEYEGGDPNRPIWSGCFWDRLDTRPATPPLPQMVVLKTTTCTLTLNDIPGVGGITIETSTGVKLSMKDTGVEIDDGKGGKIEMRGPRVTVNGGALEVI